MTNRQRCSEEAINYDWRRNERERERESEGIFNYRILLKFKLRNEGNFSKSLLTTYKASIIYGES